MHGKRALVRDLEVFREQRLSNLSYFSDNSPTALAPLVADLAQSPESMPVPSELPCWNDCVEDMLHEMGLDGQVEACPAPALQNYAAA